MNEQNGFIAMAVVTIIMILIIVATPILSLVGWHYETGKGSHTGYVTAIETEGVFFKTHRAFIKTDLASTQEDIYCVVDESLLAELDQAAQEKTQVTVKHISWLFAGIKNCKGETAVINEIINK